MKHLPFDRFVDMHDISKSVEAATSSGGVCYRCRRTVEKSHDKFFYCPEFGQLRYGGRWLHLDHILQGLREQIEPARTLSHWYTMCFEDPDNVNGLRHHVVGVGVDGHFVGRLDAPQMPEFAVVYRDEAAVAALPEASMYHGDSHEFIYKGWRPQLRAFCAKLGLDFSRLAATLGVSADHTDEEDTRWLVGWV
jgi:hypothetical protein